MLELQPPRPARRSLTPTPHPTTRPPAPPLHAHAGFGLSPRDMQVPGPPRWGAYGAPADQGYQQYAGVPPRQMQQGGALPPGGMRWRQGGMQQGMQHFNPAPGPPPGKVRSRGQGMVRQPHAWAGQRWRRPCCRFSLPACSGRPTRRPPCRRIQPVQLDTLPPPGPLPWPLPPQGGRGSVPNGSRQAGGSGGGMMGMDYGSGGHGPALMFNPFMMQHPLMMQHQQQHPGAAWGAGMMQQQVGGMGGDGCVAVGQAASVCLLRVRKARLLGLCVINPAVQPCALHAPPPPRPRRAARGTAACRWGVACTRRWVWRAPTPPTPATTLCPRAGQVGGQTRAAGGDRCCRRGARWGGGGVGGWVELAGARAGGATGLPPAAAPARPRPSHAPLCFVLCNSRLAGPSPPASGHQQHSQHGMPSRQQQQHSHASYAAAGSSQSSSAAAAAAPAPAAPQPADSVSSSQPAVEGESAAEDLSDSSAAESAPLSTAAAASPATPGQ